MRTFVLVVSVALSACARRTDITSLPSNPSPPPPAATARELPRELAQAQTLAEAMRSELEQKDGGPHDFGRPMNASEMQEEGDQWLSRNLKDPQSRRVTWGQSGPARLAGNIGKGEYGYSIEALVNAKNSFGGYVGDRRYYFFFRDGSLMWAGEQGSGYLVIFK